MADLSNSVFSIEKLGTDIFIKVGNNIIYCWAIENFNMKAFGTSKYIEVGNNDFIAQLDFSLCASSVCTTQDDLIQHISNEISSEDTIYDKSILYANGIANKVSGQFFGRNPSVGTAAEDIWVNGGNYNFLLGATTIEVTTNNIQDDITGLGARTIHITGLDSNFDELIEVVSLTGNGITTTVGQFSRINSAVIVSCGTFRGSNYNDIELNTTGSGLTIGKIAGGYGSINTSDYGIGRTQLGIFTVPNNKTLYITSVYINVDSSKIADVNLYCLANVDDITIPTSPRILLVSLDGVTDFREKTLTSYYIINEKTDIWFRASINSGTAGVDCNLSYIMIDNV